MLLLRLTLISVLGIMTTIAPLCTANPVPDAIVDELNDLPGQLVSGNDCNAEARFTDLLGWYGLSPGLMDDSTMSLLHRQFDRFAPILVESQKPIHGIDYHLQDFFRARATETQRRAMCEALRPWLSADISEAPQVGGMKITGPPQAVEHSVLCARVRAAEVLSDYGDSASTPLIQSLVERSRSKSADSTEVIWPLQQALRRLSNPCSSMFLVAIDDQAIRCCQDSTALHSVVLRTHTERPLDPSVAQALWRLLKKSHQDKPSQWGGGNWGLCFRFRSGIEGCLSPTESGRFVYTDNTRAEHWRLFLENGPLYNEVKTLLAKQ